MKNKNTRALLFSMFIVLAAGAQNKSKTFEFDALKSARQREAMLIKARAQQAQEKAAKEKGDSPQNGNALYSSNEARPVTNEQPAAKKNAKSSVGKTQ